MSKYIVARLHQNACKFWHLGNTHPDVPANWCSRAGETPDFPKPAFPCMRNAMFSHSVWLCSGLVGVLWAVCSGLRGLLWAAVSKFTVVPLRQNACKSWRLEKLIRMCRPTGAPVQAKRHIFQNRLSCARETICFQTRRGCLLCPAALLGAAWGALGHVLGAAWAALGCFGIASDGSVGCCWLLWDSFGWLWAALGWLRMAVGRTGLLWDSFGRLWAALGGFGIASDGGGLLWAALG